MASAPACARFTETASLVHNNLVCSPSGQWLACAHNSVNAGSGKLMLHDLTSGTSKDGPEVSKATSIRYLQLSHGPVLVVSSAIGTQIFNEDATTLLFFLPLNDAGVETESLKEHKGACLVPHLNHIIIGTSKGTLAAVHMPSADSCVAKAESPPSVPTAEVADVCFSTQAQTVLSVHNNADLRVWTPNADGPYVNTAAFPSSGPAPVAVAALGSRFLVAYGPGTICFYDATSCAWQVELTAHARWITAIAVNEDAGVVASVGEDTIINLWTVDAGTGTVGLQHSSIVTDKLLTGVVLRDGCAAVAAYDSDEIYNVKIA